MSEATVNIVNSLSDQHRHDLVELYKNEFWCNDREISDVEVMLNNTDIVIGLENNKKRLVGFVRVLTDYIYKATVYDLIVHPAYRGKGLGTLLMEEVINHPILSKVENIDLNCLPEMTSFYNQWRFTADLGKLKHMRLNNKTNNGP